MLSWLDIPGISGDEDAAALTATVWLADKCSGFPLTTTCLEVPVAMRREGLVRRFLCVTAVPGPRGVLPALRSMLFLEPSISDPLFFDQLELSFHFHPLRHSRSQGQSLEGTEVANPFLPRVSLTPRGGTRCVGRCCTPGDRVSACASGSEPAGLCGRFLSCQGSG